MAEDQSPQEKPKIIIDDDWKTQAQAEKQRLAEEAKAKQTSQPQAQQPAGAPAEGAEAEAAEGQRGQIPPANFTSLVNSIIMQAVMCLGGMEDPRSGKRILDLDLARYHIDTLGMLQKKTEGNLDDEEKKLLDDALGELRMNFVQISQRVQQAMAEEMKNAQSGQDGPAGQG